MERIRDISRVQPEDLMYYEGTLYVVSSVDLENDVLYLKLDDGQLFKKVLSKVSNSVFYRPKKKMFWPFVFITNPGRRKKAQDYIIKTQVEAWEENTAWQ